MTPDLTPHIPHICRWAKRRAEERRKRKLAEAERKRKEAEERERKRCAPPPPLPPPPPPPPPLPPRRRRPLPSPPPPPTTCVPRLEAERLKELARLEREHLELLTRLPKGFEEHWTNGEEDPTEGIMYYYNPTSMGEPVWEAPQISAEDEQPDDEAELGGPNFDELMARQADLDKEPIDEPPPPVEIEAVEIDAGAAADQARSPAPPTSSHPPLAARRSPLTPRPLLTTRRRRRRR